MPGVKMMHGVSVKNQSLCAAIAAGLAFAATAGSAKAEQVFAVTSNNALISFNSASPGAITSAFPQIQGLQNNERLLGIDFRPSNGLLYGVGSSNRLYTIDTSSGTVSQVGPAFSVALNGLEFGVDVNPMADALRVVSDTNRNYRINLNSGAIVSEDVPLNYANTSDPNVVHAAYLNNLPGATSTTLYDIDSGQNVLVTQDPPNSGTLTIVGGLTIDASNLGGFDIFTTAGGQNRAFLAAQQSENGTSQFYTVNLGTGAATSMGQVGGGQIITAIAVVPVPEPAALGLLGLAAGRVLVRRRTR